MIYKGIIFDLDGTLINTVKDLTDALNDTLRNHDLNEASYEQGSDWIGNGVRKLLERALNFNKAQADLDEMTVEFQKNYKKRWINKTKPYPGVDEFLKELNSKNIPFGVISNKPDDAVQFILKTLLPEVDFKVIRGHRDIDKHKPDPAQSLNAAEIMDLKPEEMLYVGDSHTDYETAKNAGMTPVLVDYGYEKKEVLNNLKDCKKLSQLSELLSTFKFEPKKIKNIFPN